MDDRYRNEVAAKIAEAERRGDLAEAAALRETIQRSTDRAGKIREPKIDSGKARKATGKAIQAALQRVKSADEDLWMHLQQSINTPFGERPSYRPPVGTGPWLVHWV